MISAAPIAPASMRESGNGRLSASSMALRLALSPPIAKIIGPPALAAGLCAVARFDPPARRFKEIGWPLREPFELSLVALHHHQCPGEIGRVVCCEAEFAAGPQLGGEP